MAEEELGVAALLDVEDLVRQPDQLSVITYLAQLYHRLQGEEGEGGEGGEGGVRRSRRKVGRRKGAIQSLMSCQASRPVSWHGGELSPGETLERDNPFTHYNLTHSREEKPAVQMRKLKKPQYSNYSSQHSETKENSPCPSSSSSSPAARRGRPASYIGISDSPRPWAPYYSRHGDQILASPSLLGEDNG